MNRFYRHAFIILAVFVLTLLFIGFVVGFTINRALAHDGYSEWKQPDGGLSCCNDADCRPTRAYLDEGGHWRAWDGQGWIAVPARALLPPNLKGDGRSHLCSRGEAVFCFSPGEPRS